MIRTTVAAVALFALLAYVGLHQASYPDEVPRRRLGQDNEHRNLSPNHQSSFAGPGSRGGGGGGRSQGGPPQRTPVRKNPYVTAEVTPPKHIAQYQQNQQGKERSDARDSSGLPSNTAEHAPMPTRNKVAKKKQLEIGRKMPTSAGAPAQQIDIPFFGEAPITMNDQGVLAIRPMEGWETKACSYFTQLPNIPKRVEQSPTRIHYHIPSCTEGELGDKLAEHFGHYLLANAAGVPYTMTCGTGAETGDSVLRMLQVNNAEPGPKPTDVTGHAYTPYDVCHACFGLSYWCEQGPDLMANLISEAMEHLAAASSVSQVEAEDAVVHLPLGRALVAGPDEGMGLVPFRSYSRLLHRVETENGPLKTISVVTEPFDHTDQAVAQRSSMIAGDFVKHLKEFFPNARVQLRNSELDSPIVSFARLYKAKSVAMCGASTFCTYPVLANPQATKFLYEALSPWVNRFKHTNDVRTWKPPRLTNRYVSSISDHQMIHWLRHQDPSADDVIAGPPLFRVPKTSFH